MDTKCEPFPDNGLTDYILITTRFILDKNNDDDKDHILLSSTNDDNINEVFEDNLINNLIDPNNTTMINILWPCQYHTCKHKRHHPRIHCHFPNTGDNDIDSALDIQVHDNNYNMTKKYWHWNGIIVITKFDDINHGDIIPMPTMHPYNKHHCITYCSKNTNIRSVLSMWIIYLINDPFQLLPDDIQNHLLAQFCLAYIHPIFTDEVSYSGAIQDVGNHENNLILEYWLKENSSKLYKYYITIMILVPYHHHP